MNRYRFLNDTKFIDFCITELMDHPAYLKNAIQWALSFEESE